jgi:zinc transporter, ZIP family
MQSMSPILAGLLGSLVAGLATGLGALPVFVRTTWSEKAQRLMLGTAGGVMLSATFFSLLLPALEVVRERGGSELRAVSIAGAGVLFGAVALWLLHACVPHEHFTKGREGPNRIHLGRNWLIVLAMAIHNLPEGLSVGVAYGVGTFSTGYAVTIGIALQNLPEGLVVAAALVAGGSSRVRAFNVALLTGLVEPIGGLVGVVAVSLSEALLPWGLGFAAGAMLFVISSEVLPETHRGGGERQATFAVVLGFVGMMALARLLG